MCYQSECHRFFSLADERADQHLHDPDRRAGQPPERPRHSHAADQSLHAGGGKLHWEVPTMHHGRLHDVPHHQVIRTKTAGPLREVLDSLDSQEMSREEEEEEDRLISGDVIDSDS